MEGLVCGRCFEGNRLSCLEERRDGVGVIVVLGEDVSLLLFNSICEKKKRMTLTAKQPYMKQVYD